MRDERLLTISTFGRAVGIPGSALRYYAAEGVLMPADVDPANGYRFYDPAQIETGVLIGKMRAAGVPLPLMRDLLQAPAGDALALVDELISHHRSDSESRQAELSLLRDAIAGAIQQPQPAHAVCRGAALASVIAQVGSATVGAADEVSGVVWELRDGLLELSATDRYWLAFRTLRTSSSEGTARAMTQLSAANEIAVHCARRGEVRVEFTADGLCLSEGQGRVLARADRIERGVPDLGRLLSTQPSAVRTVGFPQGPLAGFLRSETGRVHLMLDDARAAIVGDEGSTIEGWASEGGEPGRICVMFQAALLAAPITLCHGAEVLIEVVDDQTPVRVLSPLSDDLTCLVMPMRP